MFVGKAPRFVLALLLGAPLALTTACDPAGGTGDGGPIVPGEPTADDIDGDGIANNDDNDIDGDANANAADADMDGDRIPNEIDDDGDGDGDINIDDDTPYGSNPPGVTGPWADLDNDGIPNITDPDDDNDGRPDGIDGIGSCDGGVTVAADENHDCDGYCIEVEAGFVTCNDGALDGSGAPDRDGDGVPDSIDPDDDNDGIPDGTDTNPNGNDFCVGLEGPPPPGCFPTEEPVDPSCSTRTFNPAAPIPPRILLVVDRSGSMNTAAQGFAGSKWDATDRKSVV